MAKTFLTLFAFGVMAGTASAQLPVGVGIKVGTPLTEAYNVANSVISGSSIPNAYSSNAKDFLIGPMVEFRLPFSIAIEADALYRSVGFRRLPVITGVIISPTPITGPVSTAAAVNIDANAWEFPILLKYKFKGIPLVKPYLGAGMSFKRITGIDNIVELTHKTSTGVVLEGGLEFKLLLLRITPEIRYTGYPVASFEAPGNLLKANKNQLAFLVGFSF